MIQDNIYIILYIIPIIYIVLIYYTLLLYYCLVLCFAFIAESSKYFKVIISFTKKSKIILIEGTF